MPSSSSTMAAPPHTSSGAPHDGESDAYGRQSYAYGTRENSPQFGGGGAAASGLHFPASGAGAAFGYGGVGGGGALSNPSGRVSGHGRKGGVGVVAALKASAQRLLRGLRLRNLPFVVLFVGCLLYFFGALSGVGYVEPASSLDTPDAPAFQLGRPIVPFFHEDDEAIALARREWEMQVGRKARPKDGEWMRQHRDDRAVRRKPTIALVPPKKEAPSPPSPPPPPPGKKADEPKGKGKPLVKKAETEAQAQAQAQKVQAAKPVEADKGKAGEKGKEGAKKAAAGEEAGAVADFSGEMEDD